VAFRRAKVESGERDSTAAFAAPEPLQGNDSVTRQTWTECLIFAGLVAAGAGARVLFRDLPNFAPIAAIALFSGYFFRSPAVALAVPLVAMLASDAVIGGYEWQMMAVVYAMLALPVAFRLPLRRWLRIEGQSLGQTLTAMAGLLGFSLLSSVLFFLATNFAWWPWNDLYEHNVAGLLRSYANGLPFFRHTLAGDAIFAVALFGGYAFAANLGWMGAPQPALERRPTGA
jgi:hypothetical protein